MAIPPLNLDDRQFNDLFDEMRTFIARFAPGWTDHNASDPGIMLLELFAWLTESTIYRVNRVPESSKLQFLRMLGGKLVAAQPATLKLEIKLQKLSKPWLLPRGTYLMTTDRLTLRPLLFETLHDVTMTPATATDRVTAVVTARQTTQVQQEWVGTSDGRALQLFRLAEAAIVLPPTPYPIPPQVWVGDANGTDEQPPGKRWTFVRNFKHSEPKDKHFTVKPGLNAVAFGDGTHGKIPPAGARITVNYRSAPTFAGEVNGERLRISKGGPRQHFHLQHRILALDLEPPSTLEPVVVVVANETENGSRNGTENRPEKPWVYRANLLEMGPNADAFTVEPWHNAIRFGNGTHGRIPPAGAGIKVTYQYTTRPAQEIAPGTRFTILRTSGNVPEMAVPAEECTITALAMPTPGSDRTTLEEAQEAALAILKPRWRVITNDDFEAVVEGSGYDIARAHCLPGWNVDAAETGFVQPSHVSIAVVPRAHYRLQVPQATFAQPIAFSPTGAQMVARDPHQRVWLWNVADGRAIRCLGKWDAQSTIEFCAEGRTLLTQLLITVPCASGADQRTAGAATDPYTPCAEARAGEEPVYALRYALWNAHSGEILKHDFADGATVKRNEEGSRLTVLVDKKAELYDAHDGALVATVNHRPGTVLQVEFGPNGQLATVEEYLNLEGVLVHAVYLWDTYAGAANGELRHNTPVEQIAFSPDGTLLATLPAADAGAAEQATGTEGPHPNAGQAEYSAQTVRLWRTDTALELGTLNVAQPIRRVQFSPDQRRILIFERSHVTLWSTRSRSPMATVGNAGTLSTIRFSSDGAWLATVQQAADNLEELQLWDARRAVLVQRMEPVEPIADLVFDPQGRRLTSLSVQQSTPTVPDSATQVDIPTYRVRLWQLDDPSQPVVLHSTPATSHAQLGPNGTWFAVAEGTLLRLWSTAAMKPVSALYLDHSDGPLHQLRTIPHDRYLYTWSRHCMSQRPSSATGGEVSPPAQVCHTVQVWNAEHIFDVARLLNERRLVTCNHHVAGPRYAKVTIQADIVRSHPIKPQRELQRYISEVSLHEFFHPLRGGPDGNGWPWGRTIYRSEVYQLLERVEGVDHVEALTIICEWHGERQVSTTQENQITMPPFHLVDYVVNPDDIVIVDADTVRPARVTYRVR